MRFLESVDVDSSGTEAIMPLPPQDEQREEMPTLPRELPDPMEEPPPSEEQQNDEDELPDIPPSFVIRDLEVNIAR